MLKALKAALWLAGILGGLGLLLHWWAIDVWTIPDDPVIAASIAPALEPGDTVLLFRRGERAANDLVRCPDPEDASLHVIGRIMGLGGDHIEIRGREVHVNGIRITSRHNCVPAEVTIPHPVTGAPIDLMCEVVEFNGGIHLRAYRPSEVGSPLTPVRTQVKPGQIYLVSDNRSFHDDSRDFGMLPEGRCADLIFFRLWGRNGWKDGSRRFSWVH